MFCLSTHTDILTHIYTDTQTYRHKYTRSLDKYQSVNGRFVGRRSLYDTNSSQDHTQCQYCHMLLHVCFCHFFNYFIVYQIIILVLSTRSVFWFSRSSMAWLRIIWVSSANQTPKTLLVLDFALQHAAISKFHAARRTLEAVHSLSPGRCSGTDFLQKSGQTTHCRVSSLSLRHTISDSITSSAGALELDSMLWRLRS